MKDEEKQAMRARVDGLRLQLDAFFETEDVPISKRVVDWGKGRGQGRRIGGGMVVGAMSCNLGKKAYYSIDLSEYAKDIDETDWLCLRESHRRKKYVIARRREMCHWEAMYYAVTNKNSAR